MDGVIIDSEPLWERSESIMLKQKGFAGNNSYRKEYRKKIMGLNQKDSVRLLKETFGLDESPEEILRTRLEILLELYEKELRLVDGIPEILKILDSEKHVKTALASGSPMKVIEFVLNKFSLADTFRIKVSGTAWEKENLTPTYILRPQDVSVLIPENALRLKIP